MIRLRTKAANLLVIVIHAPIFRFKMVFGGTVEFVSSYKFEEAGRLCHLEAAVLTLHFGWNLQWLHRMILSLL